MAETTAYNIIKGYVRATGLFKQLYKYRHLGNVLVFDDADSVFQDDTSLGILKCVLDTTERRTVSWLSEGILLDEDENKIPMQFDFEGTVIFITNLDFEALVAAEHKLTPHLEALLSRAHYLDMEMKTRRDFLIRIRQVIHQGLLDKYDLTEDQLQELWSYTVDHSHKLRELSLRSLIKAADLIKLGPNWKVILDMTLLRQRR